MCPRDLCNESQLRALPNVALHQRWCPAHDRAARSCGLWEQLDLCRHTIPCNAKPHALFTPTTNKAERTSLQRRLPLCIGRWHAVHHGFEIQIQKAALDFPVGNLARKNSSRRKPDSAFVNMEGNTYKPQLWTHASEDTTTGPELKDKCKLSNKINNLL